jgi:hypothetical protein
MMTNSALNEPALLRASKIAIRDEGEAPTWFTASTKSRSSTPGFEEKHGLVGLIDVDLCILNGLRRSIGQGIGL